YEDVFYPGEVKQVKLEENEVEVQVMHVSKTDEETEAIIMDQETDGCCVTVDIRKSRRELTILSIYCKRQGEFRNEGRKIARVLRRKGGRRTIIAGDFNAKSRMWYAGETDEGGEQVEEMVFAEGLDIINPLSANVRI
ncbi:hypothetical protein J6590_107863, partial [Homalodisca vitripennis]